MAETLPHDSATAALEPLLTEIETAAALRVTDRTIRTWAANGILHVVRIGGVRRYRASDIAALIGPSTDEEDGDDRCLSIREMRALAALGADLRWDELQRRREARAISVATAIGWVGVARQILVVVGIAALALGVAGPSDVLELLRGPR